MKRLRSSEDNDSIGEKGVCRDSDSNRSAHRNYGSNNNINNNYKYENGRKGFTSYSSRYEADQDWDGSRSFRKHTDYHHLEGFERRKGFDRYRDYDSDRIRRSENFLGHRRDYLKGFRSDRNQPRREGSVTSWSKFGGNKEHDNIGKCSSDSVRGNRANTKSPKGFRDVKSPDYSRDSGSEQSKSVEVKRSKELHVESEMEEGELEPELQSEIEAKDNEMKSLSSEERVMESGEKTLSEIEKETYKVNLSNPKAETSEEKDLEGNPEAEGLTVDVDAMRVNDTRLDCEKILISKDVLTEDDEKNTMSEVKIVNDQHFDMHLLGLEKSKDINLEVKAEDVESIKETQVKVVEEDCIPRLNFETNESIQNFKDKGKSVAFTSSHTEPFKTGCSTACGDYDSQGLSIRGFDLFPSSLVIKQERADRIVVKAPSYEKLTLEPLDLSLGLPNVLLPISSRNLNPPPLDHAESFNTFCSDSEGFTASMSFTGSQQFTSHNPSCSLIQNSLDNYEGSVGSLPIFQGIDWQAHSANDTRHKEIPLCQRILMNGIRSINQPHGALESGRKILPCLDRQLSSNRPQSGIVHTRPCNDVGSYETASEYSKDKKLKPEKIGLSVYSSQKENEAVMRFGNDFVESMISSIVSEPIHVTSIKFQEMTEQSIAYLRDGISEILTNLSKQSLLFSFQTALQKRTEITSEMLLKCHRGQIEIMVALKTGLNDFLRQQNTIPSSDLVEMFLDLRCRNLNCRSIFPVDECDCNACAQKNGFCSSCMCLICSKFDTASNTCSWVGCDVCLHWCHTDCGLRKSLIRNGVSITGARGISEMQFNCIACGHPSEMYGFVKEVFQSFVKKWPVEILSKELEYVKRIFCTSKDMKGKQLHDIAHQMLAKLANGSGLPEVSNHIFRFFTEQGDASNGASLWAQQAVQRDSAYSEKGPQLERTYSEKAPQLERTASISTRFDPNNDKQTTHLKEPVFDELESIVRIKQAEAKMFQSRADEARREAECLKRITIAKNEKIEEQFRDGITKLSLAEAEHARKQKFEQLQALEKAHLEYLTMKTRMEGDIRNLLSKMEATKQSLGM